jgi:uncharacterized spore protein YtfJ
MEHINDIVDAVSSKLANVANSNVVVGTPMELGGITVVPISRVSVGLGVGGGTGEGESPDSKHGRGRGTGGGTGGAGKVRPVAVAVFKPEGVEILPIADKRGKLDGVFEKIPDLVDKIKDAVDG